jgi:GMP synthase (glutamine-hydrolysing)
LSLARNNKIIIIKQLIVGKVFADKLYMSVLILKNVPNEGPGTIEDFLIGERRAYRIVDLSAEDIPGTDDFDALVILGGPMSANDAERYPCITREIELVKDFALKKKKVLGVCLGAQIMAKAFGAKVYPGPEKEIGWYDIEVDYRGGIDRLMGSLVRHPETGEYLQKIKVFQWHGETFDIPEGGVRIAKSLLYPNQAFRYGEFAYAFQFHIEVREETIYEWLKDEPVDMEHLRKETQLFFGQYRQRAENFYRVFFGITG